MNNIKDLFDSIEPQTSDEAFINSVMKKKGIKKPVKKRILRICGVAAAAFVTLTLSVGAVNRWDYSKFFQRFFGNNESILYAFENQPDFEVAKNTFDGVDFALTGLYAESGAVFLTVDVTSEEEIFIDSFYQITGNNSGFVCFLQRSDYTEINSAAKYSSEYINSKNIKLLFAFYPEQEELPADGELILSISELSVLDFPSNEKIQTIKPDGDGVELKFNIDGVETDSTIKIYPNVQLGNSDIIIEEIKLSPYTFDIKYSGLSSEETDIPHIRAEDISFINKNGKKADDFSRTFISGISGGIGNMTFSQIFDRAVNIENIKSIVICGFEIPLDGSKIPEQDIEIVFAEDSIYYDSVLTSVVNEVAEANGYIDTE